MNRQPIDGIPELYLPIMSKCLVHHRGAMEMRLIIVHPVLKYVKIKWIKKTEHFWLGNMRVR